MVRCHCLAHKCAGADIPDAIHKRHQQETRKLLQKSMVQASSQAVQQYEDRIGQHLLEQTASSRSTDPVRSRLWGKAPLSAFDLSALDEALDDAAQGLRNESRPTLFASSVPPSHGERLRFSLDKLSSLEREVDTVLDAIRSMDGASTRSIDALAPLYETTRIVSQQVHAITVKSNAVAELRSAVQKKLKDAASGLDALQAELSPKANTRSNEEEYDACK
jgi:hypothetical protein